MANLVPFNHASFGSLPREAWAQDLWGFLNERENIHKMELASRLGHTALDGVILEVEQGWGAHLGKDGDRARQMVGAMIRAVLEPRGWVVAAQGVKVLLGHQFSVASRYEQRQEPSKAAGTGSTFLDAMAKRYGVRDGGRHYIVIPCQGIHIGVDDLKDGTRRVHAVTDRKLRADELTRVAKLVQDFKPATNIADVQFVDRHGAKSHERRYVGWEWQASGALLRQVESACEMVETLRATWLSAG